MTFWEWAKENGHNVGGTLAGWGYVQPKFGRPADRFGRYARFRADAPPDPYLVKTDAWKAKLKEYKIPHGREYGRRYSSQNRETASIITWQGEPCAISGRRYEGTKLYKAGSLEDAQNTVKRMAEESPDGIEQYRQKLEEWERQSEDAAKALAQAELAEAFLRWKLYENAAETVGYDTPHGRVLPERLESLAKKWKDEYDRQLDWAGIGKV